MGYFPDHLLPQPRFFPLPWELERLGKLLILMKVMKVSASFLWFHFSFPFSKASRLSDMAMWASVQPAACWKRTYTSSMSNKILNFHMWNMVEPRFKRLFRTTSQCTLLPAITGAWESLLTRPAWKSIKSASLKKWNAEVLQFANHFLKFPKVPHKLHDVLPPRSSFRTRTKGLSHSIAHVCRLEVEDAKQKRITFVMLFMWDLGMIIRFYRSTHSPLG